MERNIKLDAKRNTKRIHRRRTEEIVQENIGRTRIPTGMEASESNNDIEVKKKRKKPTKL